MSPTDLHAPPDPAPGAAPPAIRICSVADCDRRHYAKDLCNKHYSRLQYRYESNTDNAGKRRSGREAVADHCPRCTRQSQALTAGSGEGDRVSYFRSLSQAQLAAYMLGYGDARSGDGKAVAKVAAIVAGKPVNWAEPARR